MIPKNEANEYAKEIAELKKKQQDLEYENSILLAISHISSIFLKSTNETFERDLLHAMAIMGEAGKADRVYIWENHLHDGELCASQLYEWSGNAKPQQGKELVRNVSYVSTMPNWERTLSKGDCVRGLVKDLPSNEKDVLLAQDIVSIMVVPIFIRKHFWGFVGFDDCHNERTPTANGEKILRSASELIANALIHNQMEKNIQSLELEVEKNYYDSVTGIYNKRYFDENIERIMRILSNSNSTLSLMKVDISLPNNRGYFEGDKCLKVIANTLQNSVMRTEDFVARYSNNEFVVVLPNANENIANMIAKHMLEGVQSKSEECCVAISIGGISGEVKDTLTTKDFVRYADTMLDEAKQNGSNTYKLASF